MNRKYAIPNDYNIYCALATGKVPENIIRKLFLNRGIIASPKTRREDLATIVHDNFYKNSRGKGLGDKKLTSLEKLSQT